MVNGSAWGLTNVPDQSGTTAVITGANSGIGLETARVLVAQGARVILACRNLDKARRAADAISVHNPIGSAEIVEVDLSDLDSVRRAAADINDRVTALDLLFNNAGVAWPPYELSPQGVELQFATNFLGHFALTGLLLPSLTAARAPRVISVTSLAHRVGHLRLDDLAWSRRYRPFAAYAQSKLAVLLFTHELQSRFERAGSNARAYAAHPGGARTELIRHDLTGVAGLSSPALLRRLFQFQGAGSGALPLLRAATDLDAKGGQCFGPAGVLQLRGAPVVCSTSRRSRDAGLAQLLWETSTILAGECYHALPPEPRQLYETPPTGDQPR